MKISSTLGLLLLAAFLGTERVARAANTNQPSALSKTNQMAAATNAAPAELPIPLSVFDLTAKSTKDPFFPLSQRKPIADATNSTPAISPALFSLKGLSGAANNRLALINNRTLATGEETEITAGNEKLKVHLLAIKDSSVVIRVEGQPDPFEIFLRKAAQ